MAKGLAAKMLSERSRRLHQGQNSSSTPGSPGRPLKPNATAKERKEAYEHAKGAGYAA